MCLESRNYAIPYPAAQLASRDINITFGKFIPGFCGHIATMDKNVDARRFSFHEGKLRMNGKNVLPQILSQVKWPVYQNSYALL